GPDYPPFHAGAPAGPGQTSCRCRALRRTGLLLEQRAKLTGVVHREVPVAVVHQNVGLAGPASEASDHRNPAGELLLRVLVAEALGRRLRLPRPGLRVAAVEADHRQVLGG